MPLKLNSTGGGSVTLDVPSTASTFTATVPAQTGTIITSAGSAVVTPTMLSQPLTLMASQASTSGTVIDFTGIPSWAKRITVMFNGVSTNGTSQPMFQLGTTSGVETTGYVTYASSVTSAINITTAYTNGWQIYSGAAARVIQGNIIFTLITGNIWSGNGQFSNDSPGILWTSGTKSLAATLDRVRITTANGTDTFDAGSINILYEG